MALLLLPRRLAQTTTKACQACGALIYTRTVLAWLRLIEFPKLYVALGKRLATAPKLPPTLSPRVAEITKLQGMLALDDGATDAPPSNEAISRFVAAASRMRALGRMCYLSVRSLPTIARLASAYHSLGREALATFGKKALPPELVPRFATALSRQTQLKSQAESLSASWPLSPAATMATAAVILGIVCCAGLLLGRKPLTDSSTHAGSRARDWEAEADAGDPPETFRFSPLSRRSVARQSMWRIESDSGLNDYARQIDQAIEHGLGEVSYAFGDRQFRDVQLCLPLKRMQDSRWQYPSFVDYPFLYQTPPPASEEDRNNPRLADTRVGVDEATGRIVAVMAQMRFTELNDIQQEVLKTFGKTPQDIEQLSHFGGSSARKTTLIKYTFPETLVRVVSTRTIPLRDGYPFTNTEIWVLDRSYVEQHIRAFANAFISSCLWIHQARRSHDSRSGIPVALVPPLVDTTALTDDSQKFAVFIDPILEEEARRIEALNEKARSAGTGVLPTVNRLVAAIGSYDNGDSVIVALPAAPSTNGMDRLWIPNTNVSSYSIQDCCIYDVYFRVASVLAQAQFPPEGESISVIDPQETNYAAGWTSTQPIANQVRGAYQSTVVRRHEWVDREGWVVRVTSGGSISLSKTSGRGF
jgi:hypothetical protein